MASDSRLSAYAMGWLDNVIGEEARGREELRRGSASAAKAFVGSWGERSSGPLRMPASAADRLRWCELEGSSGGGGCCG